MKKHTPFSSVLLTIVFILSSCGPAEVADPPWKADVDSLQNHYAPDSRLAVFRVSWKQQGDMVIVKGEVDNAKARDEALAAIRARSESEIVDSVAVLPDPKLGTNGYGIVTVSVANVRSRPSHAGELSTQALMGMVVKLLKKQRNWYYVQLPDDYLGWLPERSMVITSSEGVDAWKAVRKVITTGYFALVRRQPSGEALPLCDVVAGVLMKQGGRVGSWVAVELPDGRRGYIEQASVREYERWKQTRALTAQNIEKTATMFMGVPYLWGGTSPKGMDCSGFTKVVFRLNGLEIRRDADQQSHQGEAVQAGNEFENLKKGDLLFFGDKGTETGQENVDHVGIYLGKKEFIHTPGGAWVKVDSFDPDAPNYNELLRNIFLRARRVIGTKQVPEVAAK
ncbi:MAG: NlpC/P60 family protein [Ignavibacteria bacterium]|nr:NlpC/P60 family protein [Ignavibacteria bacterium]